MLRTLLVIAALALCACRSEQLDVPGDATTDVTVRVFGASNSGGRPVLFVLAGDSPDAASSTLIGPAVAGLEQSDFLNIDVTIVGATSIGGTVDVYLQKLVSTSPDVWIDFVHFPQVAPGATKTFNVATDNFDNAPYLVGTGTDDAATPALDAGVMAHGHPGTSLRLVTVSGLATDAATDANAFGPAVVKAYINGRIRN